MKLNLGDEVNKPVRLNFTDTIPIISQEDFERDEKNVPKGAPISDKEKEDKAILSNLPVAVVKELDGYENQIGEAEPLPNNYVRFMERSGEDLDGNFSFNLFHFQGFISFHSVFLG